MESSWPQANQRISEKNKNSYPFFKEGKKDVFIKNVYLSQTGKVASIAFSAPVYDGSNTRLLGVVVSKVRMAVIEGILGKHSGLNETSSPPLEIILLSNFSFQFPGYGFKPPFFRIHYRLVIYRKGCRNKEVLA